MTLTKNTMFHNSSIIFDKKFIHSTMAHERKNDNLLCVVVHCTQHNITYMKQITFLLILWLFNTNMIVFSDIILKSLLFTIWFTNISISHSLILYWLQSKLHRIIEEINPLNRIREIIERMKYDCYFFTIFTIKRNLCNW